jgi:hypothetical protein
LGTFAEKVFFMVYSWIHIRQDAAHDARWRMGLDLKDPCYSSVPTYPSCCSLYAYQGWTSLPVQAHTLAKVITTGKSRKPFNSQRILNIRTPRKRRPGQLRSCQICSHRFHKDNH